MFKPSKSFPTAIFLETPLKDHTLWVPQHTSSSLMSWALLTSALTKRKRSFSGLRWLSQKKAEQNIIIILTIIPLGFFLLKFCSFSLSLRLLFICSHFPSPPSSWSLFSLAVSHTLLCGLCGGIARPTPQRAAGPNRGRHSGAWERRRRERPQEWRLTAGAAAAPCGPMGSHLTSEPVLLCFSHIVITCNSLTLCGLQRKKKSFVSLRTAWTLPPGLAPRLYFGTDLALLCACSNKWVCFLESLSPLLF